jgi:hypothetical protein
MQTLCVKIGLGLLLIASACSLAQGEQVVSQYRVKLVGHDHNAPSFHGFGGTVGLMQDLKVMPNGDWLCVFHAGYWHISMATPFDVPQEKLQGWRDRGMPVIDAPTGGRIMGILSRDHGRSWSMPVTILDTNTDVSPQGMAVLSDGTVLTVVNNQSSWYGYEKAPEGHSVYNTRIGIIRSTNNGRTWSQPVWLPMPIGEETFYQRAHGEPIELSNGSILFATYWSPRGFEKLRGAIHRSDDSGKTWRLVSIVGADDRVIDEPEISLLPSGRLILITRPDGAIFYSEDEGKTWQYSHTPFPKGARVKTPRFKMLSDGTLVCVMTAYGQLRLSWSTDEGKTWNTDDKGKPLRLDGSAYGQPGICLLEDESMVTSYYDGANAQQRTNVWALRLRINDDRRGYTLLPLTPRQ